ncbi:MAG TPA: META domain-containing protein [Candidatus Limnocylindrales bacterium]|nr:META domain-containing protein [Candidatus Limnocylindrales bacterium]
MRRFPILGLLVAATVLVASCSTGAGGSNGGTSSPVASAAPAGGMPATTEALSGRTFLATGTEGTELVEGSQVRLTFEATRIGASAGCNQMSGEYEVVEGILNVGPMAMTEMACEEPLMAQDTWLAAFLPGATAVLDDTTLTLTKDGTTMTLQDEENANRDRPLQGTRWVRVTTGPAGLILSAEREPGRA